MVKLYTKSNCIQCRFTKRSLNKENIPFEEINVEEDSTAYDFITKELGYKAAPVVYFSADNHWSGFNPERIQEITAIS